MVQPRIHASREPVLQLRGVGKAFGDRRILTDVTFEVLRGEFLCLVGPNGAGKSTLLKMILGLMEPTEGTILVLGKPPGKTPGAIGYVPQRKSFDRTFPATCVELIVANLRGSWPVVVTKQERDKAMAALVRTKGEHLAGRQLYALSGGETQRVFIARALVTDPQLVVLDEPAAGVDIRGREDLMELLHHISADDYLAAVMVTHSLMALSRTAEKVAYIDGTLQAFGLPSELLGHGKLAALLGGHTEDGDG
ncbi:MAG TPA: metal ABC transporter ATP-binding protein [Myxococcota bacterium]|jgi:ABC-type Mn2+/Zn2+ transport system ATPase subunit|nr:metal ABC transporter ATP-binding protein [Myxococcota bacterium]